jgi:uncharacterized protein
MSEKVGRNDPCPCGSGKKYKSCCLPKEQKMATPLGKRKFTAKVISGGGINKPQQASQDPAQAKAAIDYATLMDRSFGEALHSKEEKPPIPQNPSEYLSKENPKE